MKPKFFIAALAERIGWRRNGVKDYLFHRETNGIIRLSSLILPLHDRDHDGPLLKLTTEETSDLRRNTTRPEKMQLLHDFWSEFMIEDGQDGTDFDSDFMNFMSNMEEKYGVRTELEKFRK